MSNERTSDQRALLGRFEWTNLLHSDNGFSLKHEVNGPLNIRKKWTYVKTKHLTAHEMKRVGIIQW